MNPKTIADREADAALELARGYAEEATPDRDVRGTLKVTLSPLKETPEQRSKREGQEVFECYADGIESDDFD